MKEGPKGSYKGAIRALQLPRAVHPAALHPVSTFFRIFPKMAVQRSGRAEMFGISLKVKVLLLSIDVAAKRGKRSECSWMWSMELGLSGMIIFLRVSYWNVMDLEFFHVLSCFLLLAIICFSCLANCPCWDVIGDPYHSAGRGQSPFLVLRQQLTAATMGSRMVQENWVFAAQMKSSTQEKNFPKTSKNKFLRVLKATKPTKPQSWKLFISGASGASSKASFHLAKSRIARVLKGSAAMERRICLRNGHTELEEDFAKNEAMGGARMIKAAYIRRVWGLGFISTDWVESWKSKHGVWRTEHLTGTWNLWDFAVCFGRPLRPATWGDYLEVHLVQLSAQELVWAASQVRRLGIE